MKSFCLLITEGTTEKALLTVLLEKDLLLYRREDLVLKEPIHCRQITDNTQIMDDLTVLGGGTALKIARVGDSLRDALILPDFLTKQLSISCTDYHLRPEFEIFLILHEGLYSEFQKVKSKVTPKEFAKSHLRTMEGPYDCSYAWVSSYFSRMNGDELYQTLQRYEEKRGKRKSQEKSLFSLLKPR